MDLPLVRIVLAAEEQFSSDWKDLAASLGALTTLLGTLGGIWLGHRFQNRRDIKDLRRALYAKTVENYDTLVTRSYRIVKSERPPTESQMEWLEELNTLRGQIDLVASEAVLERLQALRGKLASKEFFDAVSSAAEENEGLVKAVIKQARAQGTAPVLPYPLAYTYEAKVREVVREERGLLIESMKKDLAE